MKCFTVFVAVLHTALAGQLQLPYLNPGGVSYVPGAQAAPLATPFAAPLVPQPSAYATTTYHGNGHFFRSPLHQVQTHQVAAPVLTHQVVAPAAAVVPTVHHVPTSVDVPVTRIHAQPGFIHKEVDVAKPAVRTNRFELRRPAIQKQFYDIEERVIVRPAGSALVELDPPHSKVHRSSVVSPLAPVHGVVAAAPGIIAASPAPPALVSPLPPFIQSPGFGISSTPNPIDQGISSDDDSVVIEARRLPQPQPQQQEQPQQIQQYQQYQPIQRNSLPSPQLPQFRSQQPQLQTQAVVRSQLQEENQQRLFELLNALPQSQPQLQPQPQPQPQLRSQLPQPQLPQPQLRSQFPQPQIQTQAVVRSQAEQSDNQQRLIELLTARQGVADVDFSGPSFRNIGDAGQVRARVLSAEVAPRDSPITGERVNTRRVVVSRPIETIEEVDVVEPVTKLERVAVQHPALFKSAHVGYERVPASVPVLGKAVAPLAYSQPLYYH